MNNSDELVEVIAKAAVKGFQQRPDQADQQPEDQQSEAVSAALAERLERLELASAERRELDLQAQAAEQKRVAAEQKRVAAERQREQEFRRKLLWRGGIGIGIAELNEISELVGWVLSLFG